MQTSEEKEQRDYTYDNDCDSPSEPIMFKAGQWVTRKEDAVVEEGTPRVVELIVASATETEPPGVVGIVRKLENPEQYRVATVQEVESAGEHIHDGILAAIEMAKLVKEAVSLYDSCSGVCEECQQEEYITCSMNLLKFKLDEILYNAATWIEE